MAKKNTMNCPYCNGMINLPKEGNLPKLKPATSREISRIEWEPLRQLLTFDKEYPPESMVEGFIWAVAREVNRYRDHMKLKEPTK